MFEDGDLEKFVAAKDLSTPYSLVRKVVMILAFFGGLRHTEVNICILVKIFLTIANNFNQSTVFAFRGVLRKQKKL